MNALLFLCFAAYNQARFAVRVHVVSVCRVADDVECEGDLPEPKVWYAPPHRYVFF